MEENFRRYPIGIQNFEDLRNNDCVYVDKTELIYRLTHTNKVYFLSRPRRFGKSLLVSTLEAYFLGKKELFQGLAMETLEKDWTVYPVLHFDFSVSKYITADMLSAVINRQLLLWEKIYQREEGETTFSLRFEGIIRRAYKQTGKQVVVLIDEYDSPMLDSNHNDEVQKEIRNIMRDFFSPLKAQGQYLRFLLLTGISKFSQMSIFSELNNLQNISMRDDYSAICGITEQELRTQLQIDIEQMAQANKETYEEACVHLKQQYDGYHFCEDTRVGLFNPFSILNAFQKLKLGNYWFQTGTPTYLVDLLKQSDYDLRLLIDGIETTFPAFSEYRAEVNNPLPMIYQSGYLTIKDYDSEVELYTLKFPNDEVRYGFLNFLVPYYTKVSDDETGFHIAKFMRELRAGEVDEFMKRLKVFFAGIPYDLSDDTERHYQAIFYIVFTLIGQFVETEVRSSHGRADAVVKTQDAVYVFEFKLNGTAEEALKQIDEKGYLIPYQLDNKQLVKIGVNFSKKTRNIDEYIVVGV